MTLSQNPRWITPTLRKDLDLLIERIRLPDHSASDTSDPDRRRRIIELSCILPGLRMCERRNAILLAQSAPVVDVATIAHTFERLSEKFDAVWPDLSSQHESILEKARSRISVLYAFANQIEEVFLRREQASLRLEEIDPNHLLSRAVPIFEPVVQYMGYESGNLIRAVQTVEYPAVLQALKRSDFD